MSALLTYLQTKSKFIDKLVENGYVFTNLSPLLHSICIHEFHDDIEILLTTTNEYIVIDALRRICIDNALFICDELCAVHALYRIIENVPKNDNVSNIQIINVAEIINYDKLIAACNNGYRIIESDTHAARYCNSSHISVQQINNACANGSYMQNIIILTTPDIHNFAKNIYSEILRITISKMSFCTRDADMLQLFENIDTLSTIINFDVRIGVICCGYYEGYTFPKKINTLTTNWMGDMWLNSFRNLRSLNVSNNPFINTCIPFAKSLKIVNANGWQCKLSDIGLKLCTKIKSLSVCDNERITTCEPFPNIKIVIADSNSGMCDSGLSYCKKLRSLSISNNKKVTTCAPFARTLKILCASFNDRMGDSGITLCTNLIHLNADGNRCITSCVPFKHTLKTLSAKCESSLSDYALKICTKLKTVFSKNNPNITDSSGYQLIN